MHGFKRKEAKEQKHWLISIQDPRGGVLKAFSIFAPTESLVLTLTIFKSFLVFQSSLNYAILRHNRNLESDNI